MESSRQRSALPRAIGSFYYSAKEKFGEPAPCQRFVAIGKFLDAEPKQVTQAKGFKPWRRRVAYRKARWLWPLHHHHEQHPALVPTANPADAPSINQIANGDFSEEPQKLSLNLHGDPCMALGAGQSSGASDQFRRSIDHQIGSSVRSGAIWQVGLLFSDPTKQGRAPVSYVSLTTSPEPAIRCGELVGHVT
jgi:hypothetical protein